MEAEVGGGSKVARLGLRLSLSLTLAPLSLGRPSDGPTQPNRWPEWLHVEFAEGPWREQDA